MRNNGCLLIALLAVVAICVCYCCSSNFVGRKSHFSPVFHNEAAKWARATGTLGYGDTQDNIQAELNKYRTVGCSPNQCNPQQFSQKVLLAIKI